MKKITVCMLIICLLLLCSACKDFKTTEEVPSTEILQIVETTLPTESIPEVSYNILDEAVYIWQDFPDVVWMSITIEIENTSSNNLYFSDSTYDLLDPDGKLVSAQNRIFAFPEILAPGEKGYLNITELYEKNFDTTVSVSPRILLEKSDLDCIRYKVTDTTFAEDDLGNIHVMGFVENNGPAAEYVTIVAVLYDSNGHCLDVKLSYIENFSPGEKIGFDAIGLNPSDLTIDSVANVVCYAYPMQVNIYYSLKTPGNISGCL